MEKVAAKLGRYELVAKLGQGGMALVYLALQRGPFSSAKLVVIKQLKRDVGNEQHFRNMFVDEARIAMRLSHPNVVSTFEFVADPGRFFLTMEFLEGLSVHQILRRVGRPQMPLDLQLWILSRVLAGLQYTHDLRDFDGSRLGIVHRDVSPSNVIVTFDGNVKLVDFGIAKVAGARSVTQNGVLKGKLGYVSPEQCLGHPTTASSDLYSVGVMLWEAIAGRRRLFGETTAKIIEARVRCTEPPIDEVCPETSPVLAKITRRALAVDPRNRFSSAKEFQHELEAYLARHDRPVGQETLATFMSAKFARDREQLRKLIEERVSKAKDDEPDEITDLGETAFGESGDVPSWDAIVELPAGPTTTSLAVHAAPAVASVEPPPAPAAKSRGGTGLFLGAVVFASVAVAAALLMNTPPPVGASRASQPSATQPMAPSGGEAARPTAVVITPIVAALPAVAVGVVAPIIAEPVRAPATPPPSTPLSEQISIRVSVRPRKAHASVQLDGAPLEHNPSVSRVQRDDLRHVVTVDAKGYLSVRQAFACDHDVNLDLRLKRKRRAAASARPTLVRVAHGETTGRDGSNQAPSAALASPPPDDTVEPTPSPEPDQEPRPAKASARLAGEDILPPLP